MIERDFSYLWFFLIFELEKKLKKFTFFKLKLIKLSLREAKNLLISTAYSLIAFFPKNKIFKLSIYFNY